MTQTRPYNQRAAELELSWVCRALNSMFLIMGTSLLPEMIASLRKIKRVASCFIGLRTSHSSWQRGGDLRTVLRTLDLSCINR